jgi:hypothetical protein
MPIFIRDSDEEEGNGFILGWVISVTVVGEE